MLQPTTEANTPDEVFVISDLHLGGEYGSEPGSRGFRINTRSQELTDFIHEVRLRAKQTRLKTELVINGDFVDFLAERGPDEKRPWRAFISDEDEAVTTLATIVERDPALFAAIGELVRSGVSLTLLLGNHDVELSLPAVRQSLRQHLGIGRSDPFQFIHDGEAYTIGDVLIEHGNRYDGWNAVDFDALRRRRSLASRHMDPYPETEFYPPPGSSLVEQVMNPIKIDYPFIDLLKPETDAAVPLLLALEPAYARDIDRIEEFSRLRSAAGEQMPRSPAQPSRLGNVGGSEWTRDSPPGAVEQILERRMDATARAELLALIAEAEEEKRRRSRQVSAGGFRSVLSFAKMLLTGDWHKRVPLLLDGLRQIQSEKLFGRKEETERVYLEAAEELSRGGFSTILFGHTHYAKQVGLKGGSTYLNTGAWTDRLRLPDQLISGSKEQALSALQKFAAAIHDKQFDDYIEYQPAFAHIRLNAAASVQSANVHDYQKGSVAAL